MASSSEDVAGNFLIYNEQYQVLICRTHGYAVRNLKQHLRTEHVSLPLMNRKAILERYSRCDLVRPSDVCSPPPGGPSIVGLRDPVDAYRCLTDGCGWLSSHENGIQHHVKSRHDHSLRQSVGSAHLWTSVKAQTFFTIGLVKWFVVRPVESVEDENEHVQQRRRQSHDRVSRSSSRPSLPLTGHAAAVQQEFSRARERHVEELEQVDDEVLKQDRTGWFNRTGWPEHLSGRNLQHLAHASRLPDRDDVLLKEAVRVVNLTVGQAVTGLSTLELELRRWIRSAKQTEIDVRPFARLQNPESQDTYTGYWRRFFCYTIRVCQALEQWTQEEEGEEASEDEEDSEEDEEEEDEAAEEGDEEPVHRTRRSRDVMKDARELYPWYGAQRGLVVELITQLSANVEEVDDQARCATLLRVCEGFIFHLVGGRPYASGLVHFLAVLGIDEDNNRLKRALDYSYMLAGVVYVTRVLGAEALLPSRQREEQQDERSRRQFLKQRREFLADGSGTPMSFMLSLLAYGKSVAMNTGNVGSVLWSKDKKTLIYHGRHVEVVLFRRMIHDAVTRAEDLLWQELMWVTERSGRFVVPLDRLDDDVSFTKRGISFISKSSNGLGHGLDWMLQQMGDERLRRWRRGPGRWRTTHVKRYLRRVNDFRSLLLFCVHTTGGQPARGTEITSIRFQNGLLQDRNVFIIDGDVVIVTRYHKSQSLFDRPKVIPRFLPARVGQLLVTYLVYVRPFHEQLQVAVTGQGWSDHIWSDKQGVWETSRLTDVIRQETARGLGERCHTLDYRHIAVSIGRVVVGESFASGYKDEIGEVEEPEVEEESGLEVQAGRGEFNGAMRYGVRIDLVKHLSARSIDTFRPLSLAWHRFLGLGTDAEVASGHATPFTEAKMMGGSGHKRVASPTLTSEVAMRTSPVGRPARRSLFSSPRVLAHSTPLFDSSSPPGSSSPLAQRAGRDPMQIEIERAMQRLFGQGSSSFRSQEQEEGVRAVLQDETPLVVVLPTGGGKTLLAMVPALIDPQGVTIMVTPFRALTDDMVDRFRQAGIECVEWRSGEVNPSTVVVVSADVAASWSFLSYAQLLCRDGWLRRVFIDECHLTFTASGWRPKLAQLRQLRALACPMILLTATLPPLLEFELMESLVVRNARFIRASTVRPHHRYMVQRCRGGALHEQVVGLCRRREEGLAREAKAVVYCRTRAMCEGVAEALGCEHYHAGAVDRTERLAQWKGRGGFIVTTSALGTGVDVPGIVLVVHVDMPYSMIDFAQETGRAGRGGEVVDSIVVVEEGSVERRLQQGVSGVDESAMAEFLVGRGCRRQMMSAYLDGGEGTPCPAVEGGARCDRCGDGLTELQERGRQEAAAWAVVRRSLDDLAEGCVACWVLGTEEDEERRGHRLTTCEQFPAYHDGPEMDDFRRHIRYEAKSHTCHRCGWSQRWCATGEDVQAVCQWPHIVVPALRMMFEDERGRMLLEACGYRGGWVAEDDWAAFGRWVGRCHPRRVFGELVSNGTAATVLMIRHGQSPATS